jgi:translation elongation factor EF-Ts
MVSDRRRRAGVDDVEALKAADLGGKTVADTITDKIATIGENMSLRRMAKLEGDTVVSYVHNAAADGMGKIGVLVALKGGDEAFGKQVAMHIAAANPASLTKPRSTRPWSRRSARSRWTSPANPASPRTSSRR